MNRSIKYILILTLPLFFATGCVIKAYKAPAFEGTVDSLYRTLEQNADTTSAPQIKWREFFTDTTLQRYIATVLEKNHSLESSRKNIEIAYAQLRTARASIAPTVNGAFQVESKSNGDNKNFSMTPATGYLGAELSWEIDIWGKLLSAKRASQAALMSSREGVQALQTMLISQTATAYYQLVSLDMQKHIILSTINNRAQYLDTIQIMKSSGKVNEVAVQQAVAQLAEAQAALPDVELSIVKTENALCLLMGTTGTGRLPRGGMIELEDAKFMPLVGVPAQLLSYRPDVRAAEQGYRNYFELYNVSRAAMYPSLSITATGGIGDLFSSHFGALSLLGGLTQPIFNGRKLRAQKEIADLQAQQAFLSFQETVLTAGKEVSDALASQLKSKEKGLAQRVQLDAYKKAYDYSFELFVNGYATYLDVLTAQTGVFNTEMSVVGTSFENVQARIELYRALGGGADAVMAQKQVIEMSKAQSDATTAARKEARKANRTNKSTKKTKY